MPVDYDEAQRLLNDTFGRAEQDLLAGRTPAMGNRGGTGDRFLFRETVFRAGYGLPAPADGGDCPEAPARSLRPTRG